MTLGAILLAGGRGSRLGGADKPLLEIDGRTLLDAALDAVHAAGATEVVAVGPERDRDVIWVREDPPFTGPAAAIVAGLAALTGDHEWVFVLACDLVRVDAVVPFLAESAVLVPADTDAVVLADHTSRPQWLTGLYRLGPLREAASALPDGGRDAPVRALVADLAVVALADPADLSADIDTWEDLERARARTESRTASPEESS